MQISDHHKGILERTVDLTPCRESSTLESVEYFSTIPISSSMMLRGMWGQVIHEHFLHYVTLHNKGIVPLTKAFVMSAAAMQTCSPMPHMMLSQLRAVETMKRKQYDCVV